MGMAVVADWGELGRIVVAVRAGGGEGFARGHLGHLLGGPASLNIRLLRIPSLNIVLRLLRIPSLNILLRIRLLRIPSLNTALRLLRILSLQHCAKIGIKESISTFKPQ